MRCPTCNRMVSFDEPRVEVESEDLDQESMTVTGTVGVTLPCVDCGTELKGTSLDYEVCFNHSCDGKSEEETELQEVTADPMDRFEDKDRNGKPIKNPRYQKHYYGATVTATIVCGKCGETIESSVDVEEQASAFDELV